ncbi:hypothetical protein MTO96_012663 [Rhipicephalus appendiculatus]
MQQIKDGIIRWQDSEHRPVSFLAPPPALFQRITRTTGSGCYVYTGLLRGVTILGHGALAKAPDDGRVRCWGNYATGAAQSPERAVRRLERSIVLGSHHLGTFQAEDGNREGMPRHTWAQVQRPATISVLGFRGRQAPRKMRASLPARWPRTKERCSRFFVRVLPGRKQRDLRSEVAPYTRCLSGVCVHEFMRTPAESLKTPRPRSPSLSEQNGDVGCGTGMKRPEGLQLEFSLFRSSKECGGEVWYGTDALNSLHECLCERHVHAKL